MNLITQRKVNQNHTCEYITTVFNKCNIPNIKIQYTVTNNRTNVDIEKTYLPYFLYFNNLIVQAGLKNYVIKGTLKISYLIICWGFKDIIKTN